MTRLPSTARGAYRALTDHKYYRYRGCAPDPDQPDRAAGNPDVPLNAWLPHTGDGAEEQRDRIDRERAAIAVCEACPVRALCAEYACTETDGHASHTEMAARSRSMRSRCSSAPSPVCGSQAFNGTSGLPAARSGWSGSGAQPRYR